MLMPAAYQPSPAITSQATASIVDTSGMQPRDTTWTKLFVGGLPYHTTDSTLRDHFKVYGDIDEAVVITDRQTGKSRGYGFVIMADRISAERACKEPNPIIDGRKANVNLAILGAKPRGNANAVAAAAVAASFPFVRAGYPASLLASNYGLPATALYTPAAYQQAILPNSSSLASALATQFYDYHPPTLAAAAHAQFPGTHFGQAAFDPYTAYLAQVQAQAQAVQQGQQHAASYAAYLPAASANPTTAAVLNPYAQAESRLQ